MAGDLTAQNNANDAPSFMVSALRDPLSGNLDRVQIIKGWLDSEGEVHERVYDVAVSDGRRIIRNQYEDMRHFLIYFL